MPERDQAALQNPLGIIFEVRLVIFVLIKNSQMKKSAKDRQRAEDRTEVVNQFLIWPR